MEQYKSPLHKTSCIGKTDVWIDTCAYEDMTYAIENGAVGATTNPTIVGEVLKKEISMWKDKVKELSGKNLQAAEDEVSWRLIEAMALRGAGLQKRSVTGRRGKMMRSSSGT